MSQFLIFLKVFFYLTLSLLCPSSIQETVTPILIRRMRRRPRRCRRCCRRSHGLGTDRIQKPLCCIYIANPHIAHHWPTGAQSLKKAIVTGTATAAAAAEHVLLILPLMVIHILLMKMESMMIISSLCRWDHHCTRVCEAALPGPEPKREGGRTGVGPCGGEGGAGSAGELLHHGSEVCGVRV